MTETIIEKNSFDFDGFVDKIYGFINDIYGIDPAILIQNVENPCMTDKEASKNLQNRSSEDLLKEMENGNDLYFPFTQAKVTSESNFIKSVDGTEYERDNNLEKIFQDYDTIGYIVSLQDSNMIFKSGIHKVIIQNNSPTPTEEINDIQRDDFEQFCSKMDSFLSEFIKN
jgi:hypothetical protein